MAAPAIFGAIPGIAPGHEFATRMEVWGAGLHRHTQAGISYTDAGADAIVVSGKYEDDLDFGALIFYTGKGGRSQETGKQVADQQLEGGNQALAKSQATGLPVRVIRKVQEGDRQYYEYAGLYRVTSYARELGRSGHAIIRFRLELIDGYRLASQEIMTTDGALTLLQDSGPESDQPAARQEALVSRLVRDTKVMREVKRLYNFCCQACGTRLHSPTGPYAEAAHIRPLGAPHTGPDTLENVLCLCSNHHVLFDLLARSVAPDGETLLGLPGALRRAAGHAISDAQLTHHRKRYDKHRRAQRVGR